MEPAWGRRLLRTLLLLLFLSGHLGSCLSLESRGREAEEQQDSKLGRGSSSSPFSYNSQRPGQQEAGRGNRHLQLHGIEVPVYKFRGEDAQLECLYDRGTDPLYSVKWYKDDREFYRYTFQRQTPKQTFPTPGVTVDAHRSNEKRVLLKDLTFNSTGIYKCEVSADSPHFHTYENLSVMVVVELPERGPTIHGGRSHYRVGDTARLNCTSSKSKPAAQLTWFINGHKATSPHLVEYYPWVHRDGLESRRLGLSFTVDKSHFLKGELVLKCQAVVAAIYTAVKEEDATVFEGEPVILEQREHLIHVRSGVPSVLPALWTFRLALAILICGQAVT